MGKSGESTVGLKQIEKQFNLKIESLESKIGGEKAITQRDLDQIEFDIKNQVRELTNQIENV